jgi:hypothetical protein
MDSIAFCAQCRGIRVSWNQRYIVHCLICKKWISKSFKMLILVVLVAIFAFGFPDSNGSVYSHIPTPVSAPAEASRTISDSVPAGPAVTAMESFLARYKVGEPHRSRIAQAIVHSSRKYDVDSRLVAGIMIVESSANPFAISGRDSIGIMQIHLPTWGEAADEEDINLFKIEDNVDFGVRILSDYIRQYGLWDGVKRYKGWFDNPTSIQNAEEYLQKVQRIYGYDSPVTVTESLQ